MYERWQLGLAKEIKAVRLFGLTLVSGDTVELSIPDGEKKHFVILNKEFKPEEAGCGNNRTAISCVKRLFVIDASGF